MKKDTLKGYALGLLTAAAVTTLFGGAAATTTRTIEVSPIAVTLNGVPFTPRDANGDEVFIFEYNGTTYAPVRAFCGIAGLNVGYDGEKRVARVETYDYATANDSSEYITQDTARQIALKDAGVDEKSASFLKCRLDWEDGRAVYDVEFCKGDTEYDYELDAITGAILEKDSECEDFDWNHRDDYHNDHHEHHSASSADLIAEDKAVQTALDDAGVKKSDAVRLHTELDYDDGVTVYKVEFYAGAYEYEYEIDAQSGRILEKDIDRD